MSIYIQLNLKKPTQAVNEQLFYKVIRDNYWKKVVGRVRENKQKMMAAQEMGHTHEAEKFKAAADSQKKKLPGFIFQGHFLETESENKRKAAWRKQEAVVLNGLCMIDVDHLDDARSTYESFKSKVDFDQEGIMMVYVTPSGHGLKIVFKARMEWGNLIDNQYRMASRLGVEVDEACKDASRLSFICIEQDLLYINKEIFTYESQAYSERWSENYRKGKSQPTMVDHDEKVGATADKAVQKPVESGDSDVIDMTGEELTKVPDTYHGVAYHDIINMWLEGKTPQVGDRHTTLLKLATQIRYICDRSAEKVTQVLKQEQWVADYMEEDASALTAIRDACEYRYSMNMPKKLQTVLAKVLPKEQVEEEEYGGLPFALWGSKIEAMMGDYPCLREVCATLKSNQFPAALFASAAFFGTLMTRTWYYFYHLPEQERRLNYSIFIIGDPGSGKSFVGRLYNLIAKPIILNDQVGNEAINRYKKAVKERGTSTKEQKKDVLKQPTPVIRIHGTRTANGVFIEDMCNAVEMVGDKPMHLHMLTFDAELDASTAAAKGGQWIDKSTMELKAFHNEEDNQQYKNVDSVTGPFNVFWNFVYTGTPLSLDRKVTERNFGSGLSTRLACIPFPGDNLEMMDWQERNAATRDADTMQREWAFRLDKVSGELPIQPLVKAVYEWTSNRMAIAKLNANKADGLIIKRIAYYGIAISMPFILMRHWEEWEKSHTISIDEKDLALANLVMNIQYECQRYFFGGYAERYFDNLSSDRLVKGAKHKDKTISLYREVKEEFMLEDLYSAFDMPQSTIRKMVSLWMTQGLVESNGRKPSVYRKLA